MEVYVDKSRHDIFAGDIDDLVAVLPADREFDPAVAQDDIGAFDAVRRYRQAAFESNCLHIVSQNLFCLTCCRIPNVEYRIISAISLLLFQYKTANLLKPVGLGRGEVACARHIRLRRENKDRYAKGQKVANNRPNRGKNSIIWISS